MTSFSKLITKCLRAWVAWNDRKRMEKAFPGYTERRRKMDDYRRRHQKNKALQEQKRLTTNALRGGR
jgi:hypothetical protein